MGINRLDEEEIPCNCLNSLNDFAPFTSETAALSRRSHRFGVEVELYTKDKSLLHDHGAM
jgi:hypothetical protein